MTYYYFRFLLRGKWHEVPIGDKIFGNSPSREFASSLRFLAMTVNFPCHRERKRGDPLEKVCGIYSVLYSKGLPRSLCSLAMTVIMRTENIK